MEEHDLGSEPEKRGGPARHRGKHAKGGTTHPINEYNAKGSPETEEASDRTPAFSKGGRGKRAAGGLAGGSAPSARADRPSRARGGPVPKLADGGKTKLAGGGEVRKLARGGASNPYSSGRNLQSLDNSKEGKGYEGANVPDEP